MQRSIAGLLTISVLLIFSVVLHAQEAVTITISSTDELGQFLVDEEGRTLYIFTEDAPFFSNCADACLDAWPAVTVDSLDAEIVRDGIAGEFAVIENEDGTFQVAYNRQPLYTFASEDAGSTSGEGVGDVWFVARPQILDLSTTDELGSFLVDSDGNSLYLFTVDEEGVSNCTGDCLGAWPAFTVSNADELVAGYGVVAQEDLTLLEREDTGELQVVYKGLPLYYFTSDTAAGDVTGQGVGDVWFVVNPVALSVTEDGILVGRDGTTLYTTTLEDCSGRCLEIWPPLLANTVDLANIDSALQASVSLLDLEDGSQIVAFDGQALYYFVADAVPGDATGEGVGDVWFTATADVSAAASGDVCTVTPASNVNLRGGPSTLYGLQGTLLTTDAPTVVGQANGTDGFVWYQLESSAWVRSDLVTASGNCDGVPTVAAPPLPPTPIPQPTTAPADQPSDPAPPPPPATTEEA
ncbi:MAG: hypothetical protein AAF846_29160 [Chloroflexota bacterium]